MNSASYGKRRDKSERESEQKCDMKMRDLRHASGTFSFGAEEDPEKIGNFPFFSFNSSKVGEIILDPVSF